MDNHTLLFKRLMENISVSVFFKDLESRFIAINKTCANKFGISDPDEAIGKTDFDYFSLVHAQVAFEDEQRVIQTLQPIIDKEEKEVFLDGGEETVRWSSTSKYPLINDKGELIGTYGVSKDVTDKRRNYEEIQRLKEQVEAILNAVPNLIFVKDGNGVFRMANASANDFFNTKDGSIVGKTDKDLGVSLDQAKKFATVERKVIENQKPVFFPEEKTVLRDKTEVWHQTLKVPFKISKTNEPAVLSVITDVSNRIKQEKELTQAIDRIEKQNNRLLNFAHTVTHNLRNHISGIVMLTETMKTEKNEEIKASYFELLDVAANRLDTTIKDLNEIIDNQHKVEGNINKVNLKKSLRKIIDILATDIISSGITIKDEIPPNFTFDYQCAYLDSIMLNLVSNAIKYRNQEVDSEITIKAYEEEDQIYLEVADNGLGIDLKKYGDNLFGMYKTFHENENSKGIGLYITRNQIESMGGHIQVESEPGVGSTFTVYFGPKERKD